MKRKFSSYSSLLIAAKRTFAIAEQFAKVKRKLHCCAAEESKEEALGSPQ